MTDKDIKLENAHILFGDALARLKELPDNSIDSIVTDPPYGLSDNKHVATTIEKWITGDRSFIPDGKGFMGKAWDSFVPPPAIWDECLRVLKPGGHLLAFFGSRTQDIGALSIRLAGFEIRDSIAWVYGSGFPKSLDISKAIDKQAGAERNIWPTIAMQESTELSKISKNRRCAMCLKALASGNPCQCNRTSAPTTPAAKQYSGWGTALKPAVEPIIVARKPLSEKTVANNVLKWGTGGLNIEASRVGTDKIVINGQGNDNMFHGEFSGKIDNPERTGRFPANIILDESAAKVLDKQSGVSKSGNNKEVKGTGGIWSKSSGLPVGPEYGDTGGASRFFYVAKASKKDRNEGLEELEDILYAASNQAKAELARGNTEFDDTKGLHNQVKASKNFHPTVKPTALMEYLIKLVTPVDGTVLDPFTGSGSTGKAALLNGFKFIGCELTEEYLPIIEGRLKFAADKYTKQQAEKAQKAAETLFPEEEN